MAQSRVFQNAKWIIICKIIQSLLQLAIGMISARYLGPSNYGLINYAASLVAFAVPIMQLGLRSTLVQEFVSAPDKEGEIIGTTLVMNLIAGSACMVGIICFSLIANRGETETIMVCALYSISLLFQALEMVQYWYQAKLLSKHSSLSMLIAYVFVSAYKIGLLVSGSSVFWFALSYSVEYGVGSILMLFCYPKLGGKRLRFSITMAKRLVSKSKYYILANMMVIVFQSTDHVMLKLMISDTENGYYTAAVTCASVTAFVYNAILDSGRPAVLQSKTDSKDVYEMNISKLYSVFVYLTLAQAICFGLAATLIVTLLYGNSYLPAVPVLRIIVWQQTFAYMGSVRNIWILGEENHSILWKINLCGVAANVFLNALLIPSWGACGAALASVLTQFITNFVVGFFMKSICRNNYLLLRGFNPKYLIELVKEFRK